MTSEGFAAKAAMIFSEVSARRAAARGGTLGQECVGFIRR